MTTEITTRRVSVEAKLLLDVPADVPDNDLGRWIDTWLRAHLGLKEPKGADNLTLYQLHDGMLRCYADDEDIQVYDAEEFDWRPIESG